ncbi:MAG: TRAP transporter small permease [Afipia sp.]|nr:TRAP transporter small permease [Afipia sp.]
MSHEEADFIGQLGARVSRTSMALAEKLLGWLERPIQLMLWAGVLAAFAMMLHVAADVTGRTVFGSPLAGTTEIVASWYMVAISFLPWAWLSKNDNHIAAGMFQHLGGPRFDFWVEVAAKIWTLVFLCVFVWQTCVQAIRQTALGEVWQAAGNFILIWPTRWILPIAGIVMMLYLVLRIIRDLLHHFRL